MFRQALFEAPRDVLEDVAGIVHLQAVERLPDRFEILPRGEHLLPLPDRSWVEEMVRTAKVKPEPSSLASRR